MERKQNVPALRFQGFSGEWKSEILSKICDIFDGVHQTPHYTFSGVPFLSVENIKTLKSNKYISWESFYKDFKVYPQSNDLLMTRIGDIGTANVVRTNEPKGYYVTLALLKAPKYHSFFLKEAISSTSVQADLWHRTLHTAFPKKINKNEIEKVVIKAPKQLEEQNSIGSLFEYIENLIEDKSKKIQKLQQFRQAMLAKLFPREGAAEPELRFRGFSDKWKKKRIGEVINVLSAARVHKDKWRTNGVPYFRASDVIAAFKGEKNPKVFISYDLYKEMIKISGSLEKGDILITGGGTTGIPYIVPDNLPLYTRDADLLWLKRTKELDSYFLFTYFQTLYFRQYLESTSHIGAILHYTIEQAKSTPIIFPSIVEQKAIGDFFYQLDRYISLQQKKLERMQRLRAALLEKLFV